MTAKRKLYFNGDVQIILSSHHYIEKENTIYYAETRQQAEALSKHDKTPLVSSGYIAMKREKK